MVKRDSWWKVFLLLLTIVIGTIYAIPNLFGDDPAVQVIGRRGFDVTQVQEQLVKAALASEQIGYRDLSWKKDGMLLRFYTQDSQLKAKDAIENALGSHYVTALDLVPATPMWLANLGAAPMKLGLDLRGGIHFVLQVDMQTVLRNQAGSFLQEIKMKLANQHIAYTDMRLAPEQAEVEAPELIIQAADTATVKRLVSQELGSQLLLLPESDRNTLYYKLSDETIVQAKKSALSQTETVMRNRVNELGVAEASVASQGKNRVVVELPGVQDAAQAKELIGGTATLKFMLVDQAHSVDAALKGQGPVGSTIYWNDKERPVLLKNQVILTGKAVVGATVGFDRDNRPAVNVRLTGNEVSNFSKVTRDNVGKGMAVVLVQTTLSSKKINGKDVFQRKTSERVISIATIQQALGNSFQITGIGEVKDAQSLAIQIRAGALPAPVQIVEDQVIGPTLGAQNIHIGLVSLAAAMIVTLLFMLVYYRAFGIYANIALILNMIFLFAIMSVMGATMSLPGIAAAVLHIGMAVDANVLIFERIREELRAGISPHKAISQGFDRALATIVDSNLTTLIVAVVLFAIGTGSVKGFAVVLIIGIVTSLLTAVTMTRGMVNFVYGNRPIKKLSIGI
ncbi:protein translocase subunit SecD [Piscirickettsia salmonis]|uniref:protein translocase subunit SecD n=1 Tax=Piscirickettsia salmonis TaxID=1238 RepID=UPI0007C87F44|nr:preprotein translocase subunit SecD [Piscirickettsiaceae bacterium NZ-RLO1]